MEIAHGDTLQGFKDKEKGGVVVGGEPRLITFSFLFHGYHNLNDELDQFLLTYTRSNK